ncbi:hypothetical protein KM176_06115 [Pseudooceanicola sp. CBS1P-1]|uniref:Uncharacterized protein n=1 Tax=Pseudooceanicola albus TaxID=2692189 RepID=A0A6L7FWK6_9RHOB|nr:MULTISPECIES: hypothetical protein [Pseudooceanicola]MBT9383427.1 hypothetical protein [Pseudooceanicola endophyticus]MXN16251.1 hypothetical protein [Pseudooceanicola albus]
MPATLPPIEIRRILGGRLRSDGDGRLTGCEIEVMSPGGPCCLKLDRSGTDALFDLLRAARTDFR